MMDCHLGLSSHETSQQQGALDESEMRKPVDPNWKRVLPRW
jgi:hypothetical protein